MLPPRTIPIRASQGYYVSLSNNLISLERLNYADDSMPLVTDARIKFESDTYYTLKVAARGQHLHRLGGR